MSETILVVEDYDDTRLLMRFQLEIRGYKVVEAANGQEALDIVERECPDLILMDMSLPLVDGLTATRLIHEMENFCDIPIVAVTAHSESEYRQKALAAGCAEFVNKPIDFAQLDAVMRRYLAEA